MIYPDYIMGLAEVLMWDPCLPELLTITREAFWFLN